MDYDSEQHLFLKSFYTLQNQSKKMSLFHIRCMYQNKSYYKLMSTKTIPTPPTLFVIDKPTQRTRAHTD